MTIDDINPLTLVNAYDVLKQEMYVLILSRSLHWALLLEGAIIISRTCEGALLIEERYY